MSYNNGTGLTTAIFSVGGVELKAKAAIKQATLATMDSTSDLAKTESSSIRDSQSVICTKYHHDLPYTLNIRFTRDTSLDDVSKAGTTEWVAKSFPATSPFMVFVFYADDGGAYYQASNNINLLHVGFRCDYDYVAGLGTDEGDKLAEIFELTPNRIKYLPSLAPRASLYTGVSKIPVVSGTILRGDGMFSNSRIFSDYTATGFKDGVFFCREQKVIDDWADGRPSGGLSSNSFSEKIEFSGLVFHNGDFASAVVTIINGRDVTFADIQTINCGGLKVFHELEMNGRYSTGDNTVDPETDNAVTAGFNAGGFDDLCSNISARQLKINAGRYSYSVGDGVRASAVRLNFCKDFVVSHVDAEYAGVSWWGGSARAGRGGELKWHRRCRDGVIKAVNCRYTHGAVYGNNGHNIDISGCTGVDITDTAFDLEGCTYCKVRGCHSENAANFNYSIFFASLGNKFTDCTGTQSDSAALLRDRFSETNFAPGYGRTHFKRISGFEDPDYAHSAIVEGCTFEYTGSVGFGITVVDSFLDLTYKNNDHHNVVFDNRQQANSRRSFNDGNDFTFYRAARDNDVLITFGSTSNANDGSHWSGGTIRSMVQQPSGVIPLVAEARSFGGVSITDVVDVRVEVPDIDIAIGYGDVRDARPGGHAFRIYRNVVSNGCDIQNIGTNETSGGDPARLDSDRNFTTTFSPVAVNTAEVSGLRDNLVFGLDVARQV